MTKRLERRTVDRMALRDRDNNVVEIAEKTTERWVDDQDGSVEEIITFSANLTDGEVLTKVTQYGPICSKWRCGTRLGHQHLTCVRDGRPVCKRHSIQYRGKTYHRGWCVMYARFCHLLHWLFSPVGSQEKE
jgi:hypothetical protein